MFGPCPLIALPIFITSGLYHAIFRYAGWQASLTVAQAMASYTMLYAAVFILVGVPGVPRLVGLIQPMPLFLVVAGSRLLLCFWLGDLYRVILVRAALPKALIYGAGQAGQHLPRRWWRLLSGCSRMMNCGVAWALEGVSGLWRNSAKHR
ncbi:MAG: hypothetical protein NNA22_06330 [Nitrospira sp.]|nr:hypothetical protein [Nitrospira sp.]